METKLNLKKEKETKIENKKLWSLWHQIQHENERKRWKYGRSIILIWNTKHSSEYNSNPRLNHLKRSWYRQDSKAGLQVKDQFIYLQWKHSNSKRSNSCDSPSFRKISNSLSITPNKDNSPLCFGEFSRQTRTIQRRLKLKKCLWKSPNAGVWLPPGPTNAPKLAHQYTHTHTHRDMGEDRKN